MGVAIEILSVNRKSPNIVSNVNNSFFIGRIPFFVCLKNKKQSSCLFIYRLLSCEFFIFYNSDKTRILMVNLLLIRRLKPWASNVSKRLVKTPKVYIRDSGISHALLNIVNYNDLLGHPVVGGSWEGFVIENIMSVLPSGVHAFYYRTTGGAEIDLILEFWGKDKWAIEIKRSSAPKLSKGFHLACDDIKPNKNFVLYSGKDRFSIGNDITAISLLNLMKELIQIDQE